MNNEAERIAIVLAGGSGLRLGADVPKAFVPLLGRPLLWRSVWALVKAAAPDRVVVVVPDGQVRSAQEALDDIEPRPEVVIGGATRMRSLEQALAACGADPLAIAFVHDAARPFVSPDVVGRLLAAIGSNGVDAAIPVTMPAQTAKWLTPGGGEVVLTLERGRVALAETPQAVRLGRLREGLDQALSCGFEAPDEASLIERIGGMVRAVDGGRSSLKVTWPEDLRAAELQAQSEE